MTSQKIRVNTENVRAGKNALHDLVGKKIPETTKITQNLTTNNIP